MSYYHRVEGAELDTSMASPVSGTSSLQVVVGLSPVNMTREPAEAVNKPVIAYTYAEAVRQLGYCSDFKHYTLCQSMDASFKVFSVSPVVFINVLDPARHKKEYQMVAVPVVSGIATIQEVGILLEGLTVEAGEKTLVPEADYVTQFNAKGGLEITLLATENTTGVAELKVSGAQLDPEKVTKEDIIGGYNAVTGEETGLELIRQVYPRFGIVPGVIVAPGWSKIPEVAAVLAAKCEGLNGVFTCECAVDLDTETNTIYSSLKEGKEAMGFASRHGILLWPKVKLGEAVYDYSAVWAAMTAYTDAENHDVPKRSPSNVLIRMGAAVLEDGTEVVLDTSQAELVNSYGIVTAVNDNGWRAWGNNTAAYPGVTDPKDRWICCRRMMSWYRNRFILSYKEKVDSPMDPRLIESLVDAENQYLNSLTNTGDIAGGEIRYNEEDNSMEAILNGKIVFYTKIAFWIPAEYILNNIEFDPTILQSALGGA